MSLRGWRIVRRRWNSASYWFDDQVNSSHMQRFQRVSAAATNQSFLVRLRSISSAVINGSSANDRGSGGPRKPLEGSLGKDQDVPEGAEDKRMWRKWIEERLAQSGSAVEETNSSLGGASEFVESAKSSFGTASRTTEEYDASSSGSFQFEEPVKHTFSPEDKSVVKRTSLDSIFGTALKSSPTTGNAEDSRTSNFKNPFRRGNVKSSFFPDREPHKNTRIGAKRDPLFTESAKQPSSFPGGPTGGARQVPGYARQAPLDNLQVEALDEFEYRVLGSARDEQDPVDDDFLRDLDDIGRSARGIQYEDDDDLDKDEDEDWGDEKAQVLSDLALSNSQEFDLEDEENPYRLRSDRLFFPGQTYDPEDLDLSKEADVEKPTVRTRRRYPSKEVYRIADFRNPRYLSKFIRETSRLLPKRYFQISAKAQRKVAREIKTARILGLMPFTSMGDPPFRFLRSRSEEDSSSRVDDY